MKSYRTRWFDVVAFRRPRAAEWAMPAAIGVGIGVAAGFGLGILFAPQSGHDARMRLREGATKVKEKAADLAGRARSQIAAAQNELRPTQQNELRPIQS